MKPAPHPDSCGAFLQCIPATCSAAHSSSVFPVAYFLLRISHYVFLWFMRQGFCRGDCCIFTLQNIPLTFIIETLRFHQANYGMNHSIENSIPVEMIQGQKVFCPP